MNFHKKLYDIAGTHPNKIRGRIYEGLRRKYGKSRNEFNLEMHIVDHCNLKCKCCSHYSSVSDEWFISEKEFEDQIKVVAPVLKGNITRFSLLGGEPLLHPNINTLAKIARKYFPDEIIWIITNGLLIKQMSDEFWNVVRENRITISLSEYPCGADYKDIKKYIKSQGALLTVYGVRKNFSFRPLSLHNSEYRKNFWNCVLKSKCLQLRNGKIYPCAICAYNDILNKRFGTDFKCVESDFIRIENLKSIKDIYKFRSKPKKVCGYCNMDKVKLIEWGQSSFEISEWIENV